MIRSCFFKTWGTHQVKGWLVVNALGHCIFTGLKRVRLLEVNKVLP
jgi:hypothetical protein